jgi:hypothetical protein
MSDYLADAHAGTPADLSYLPRGFGPGWVWARLRVYLLAVTVAVSAFLVWRGVASKGIGSYVEAAFVVSVAFVALTDRGRTIGKSCLGYFHVSDNREIQAGAAAVALFAIGALALIILLEFPYPGIFQVISR